MIIKVVINIKSQVQLFKMFMETVKRKDEEEVMLFSSQWNCYLEIE